VSVLASETFDADGPAKRPSVQVGDPFAEKVLIECCLELFAAGVVTGIQDLGGAGLSCATSRAREQRRRRHARLARPGAAARRDAHARGDPHERVAGAHVRGRRPRTTSTRSWPSARKWDVIATVIGEVNDSGRLTVEWHGEQIVDVPPRTVAHEGPVYERPYARPSWQDALQADEPPTLPATDRRRGAARHDAAHGRSRRTWRPSRGSPTSTTATSSATPCSRSRRTPAWCASTTRPNRGVAVSTDCNGRFAKLDPYAGAQLALAEAYRNVAARARAARRHQLPELRLARGPGA
jgi:phosphoribosylformylglycinamidine synthase subunit PurL